MKTVILFLCIVSASFCYAQKPTFMINDMAIDMLPVYYIKATYMEASPTATFTQKNKKGTLRLDYGQDYDKVKELILKDREGKIITFNSDVEVINLFESCGWKLFSYQNYVSQYLTTTVCLFKKE